MKKPDSIYRWSARIICIVAILFVSLFALDSFDAELSIWQQLSAFLIHLIPSFILIVLLVLAWKWEQIGGILFIMLGLFTSPFIFNLNYNMNNSIWMSLGVILMITFPFIVVGVLFLLSNSKNNQINRKD